jgi:transcriptional regulator with XRE-family HTH domain
MDTTGDRLRQIIAGQAVNVKDFCTKNDLSYSGISNIINGERELGMNVLRQLKKVVPNMDIDWLLFGTSRKDVNPYENPQELRIIDEPEKIGDSDIFLRGLLQCLDNESVQEKLKDILNK